MDRPHFKQSRLERLQILESELESDAKELGNLFWDHDDDEPRGPHGEEICDAMDLVLELLRNEIERRD